MSGPQMPAGGLFSYFTRHRTAANLAMLLLVLAGVYAALNIRAQFLPDTVVEEIRVTATWSGAGAEDVDDAVIGALGPALLAVEGVTEVTSTAREGSARIDVEFEPGWDMGRASDEVSTAMDLVSTLPEGVDRPEVRRTAWRDRVTDIIISGPLDRAQLGQLADELTVRLYGAGITRTSILGEPQPGVTVEVSQATLMREGLTLAEIAAAIGAEAAADPAGDLGATARLRTGIERRAPSEIAAIVLRSDGDTDLTVGDVATIRAERGERGREYVKDGRDAVIMTVQRDASGDAFAIQEAVTRTVEEMRLSLPDGVRIEMLNGRTDVIRARLDLLLDNAGLGLALVVALLFLFLSARAAIWVAAGIPVALIAAIAVMFAGNITVNMVSLFALIICLGIVVDDAIVVAEHADARRRDLGEDPDTAAERAATRMFPPVFSATITTVVAFFGLTVIGGRFGDLILDIPLTVIAVLIASLIECFLILPHHMAKAMKSSGRRAWYDWPSHVVGIGFDWVRRRLFRPFVVWVIRLRYPVLAATALALALAISAIARGDVVWRFWSPPERDSVTVNFAMLPGTERAESRAFLDETMRAVAAVAARTEAETGIDPVAFVLGQVGGESGRGLAGAGDKDPDELGSLTIGLIDADLRVGLSTSAFLRAVEDEVARPPSLETFAARGGWAGPGGDAIDVALSGASSATLKAAAEALKGALAAYPEVTALEDTLAYDKVELILDLTPQGQALGFSIDDIGRELRNRLGGIEAAEFPDGPRTATVMVEVPEAERQADFIETTRIATASGTYVPLADIVTVDRRLGFATVRRENGVRTVSVTGEIDQDDPARAAEITEALATQILPDIAARFAVDWQLEGLSEQEDAFLSDALLGFLMVIACIYLVLSWIFASWTRPIVVMAIIPFGLIGTVIGHWHWDVALSIFTVVGLLGMTGIIINDSIVLVTTIDEHAKRRGLVPAVVSGVTDRLRAVFLTTATTVLGLVPLLYEGSMQAQFLKPTVITLCYGLGFGVVLILLVVPSLIVVQRDVAQAVGSLRRALRRGSGIARPVAGAAAASLAVVLLTVGAWLATGSKAAVGLGLGALVPLPGLAAAWALMLLGLLAVMAAALALGGRAARG